MAREAGRAALWILAFVGLAIGARVAIAAVQALTEPQVLLMVAPCDEEPAPALERAL